MSDYLTPDQLRDLYAETIARARFERWNYAEEHWNGMRSDLVTEAMRDVDALAAAGLLPIGHDERWGYVTQWGGCPPHLVADVDDVPPPPPAPGKGRGPR